jgi:uncharacterized membrane protein YfcA
MPLALIAIGFIAGIAAGMFGIGGGVIIVPALVTFVSFTLTQATGTSLAALLMPVSIFAVFEYHRAGKLHIATAAWVALGLAIGALGGANLALSLDTRTLQQLYGIFLIYAGWRFAEPRKWLSKAQTAQESDEKTATAVGRWYWLLAIGLLAGVASGMFGIGGGIVIVPALVGLLRFDQKTAVGTSLAALLLPVALGGVYAYYVAGELDIGVAALVAVGLVGGAFVGAKVALGLPSLTVRRLYGLFLFAAAVRFILS